MDMPNSPRRVSTVFSCFLGLAVAGLGASPAAAAPPDPGAPPTLGGDGGSSAGAPGMGPEEQVCQGKSIGAPCAMPNDQPGTCGEGLCSRLDYSGGSPPKATEEACVVCKPSSGPGKPPILGGDGGGGAEGDSKAGEGGSKTEDKPPESASRCTISDDANSTNTVSLALFVLGLACLRRRRRTKA